MRHLVLSLLFVIPVALIAPVPTLGQNASDSVDPASGSLDVKLVNGCPEYLRSLKSFDNPKTTWYGVLSKLDSRSVIFVTWDDSLVPPHCWLIGLKANQIISTLELVLHASQEGAFESEGVFHWSDQTPWEYQLQYSPGSRVVSTVEGIGSGAQLASFLRRFSLGVRLEPFLMFGENLDHSGSKAVVSVLSLYLVPNFQILPRLFLEARLGILAGGSDGAFSGFEEGGFLRYYPFQSNVYVVGGVTAHINDGYNQGMSYHVTTAHAEFTLLSFGVGLSLSRSFALDVSFTYPIDRQYGQVDVVDIGVYPYSVATYYKSVNGMLKMGGCWYMF